VKKNWTKIAIALGPVIVLGSIVWEYARTNPEFTFLIQPWSLRGYDVDHGEVFLVAGLLVLIGAVATTWEGALRIPVSAAITAYFVIAGTVFAAVYGNETITIDLTVVANVVLSLIIAASVSLSLRSLLGERVRLFRRALPVGVVLFVFFIIVFNLTILGVETTLQTWMVVLFVFLLAAGLALSIKPANMAANRILILVSVMFWSLIVFSAGAIRETLIRVQAETEQIGGAVGVSAQYKDTQAASGWWIAGFGATLLFIGAVGLWAKRRDVVAAIQRARKQRAAAEKSAQEIADAAEAYAREQATASQQ
jgi:hypothetical protein